jgi:hypothetical protein
MSARFGLRGTAALALGLLAAMGLPAFGEEPEAPARYYCYQDVMAHGTKGGGTLQVNGYTIEIKPNPSSLEGECEATIRSPKGEIVYQEEDWGIDIDPITGKDVNGDGQPDAVLVDFSGGAHCCWTYNIISLGRKPGLIRDFENRDTATFEDLRRDGRIEILVRDGGFDEFDRLMHPESPFPLVILRLEGDKFVDVGAEYLEVYDKEIRELRAGMNASSLDSFLHSNPAEFDPNEPENEHFDYEETERRVLMIVVDYLYSGRSTLAWKSLDEMWPAGDRERIRGAILEQFCNGFLSEVKTDPSPECRDIPLP